MQEIMTETVPYIDASGNHGIPPGVPDGVSCVDEDENLRLFHYRECTNGAPLELRKWRGVITDRSEPPRIVFRSLPYTEEYIVPGEDEKFVVEKYLCGNDFSEEWRIYPSFEGTLFRVYFYSGRWYVSTHRKLNAFESYWSSNTSFGEKFRRGVLCITTIEEFFGALDPSRIHFFFLHNDSENRIVCLASASAPPKLFFLLSTNPAGEDLVYDPGFNFPCHQPLTGLRTTEDVLQLMRNSVDVAVTQGLVFFHRTRNEQFKLYHPEYKRLAALRDNCPSLSQRYFQVRVAGQEQRLGFMGLYAEHADAFREYEKDLERLTAELHGAYLSRYVRHERKWVPTAYLSILRRCHALYLQSCITQERKCVTPEVVRDVLERTDPDALYHLVRLFREQ
jgi:hypothetical protein